MENKSLIVLLFASIISFIAGNAWQKNMAEEPLESTIYRQAEVSKSSGDWGSIFMYNNDETETYGTENMLTAVLEFLPGQKLQDPHQHAEEEFSFIIDGSGTWSLNGEDVPIKKGDLMYAKPWDWHGIENTGSDTLRFFVVKWNNKGVDRPEK